MPRYRKVVLSIAISCLLLSGVAMPGHAEQLIAPTPPMGWNSWDSYGLTVTEREWKQNASWLAAHLKQYGWQYAVVDEGWYLDNPEAKPGAFRFLLNSDGLYVPAPARFPSAAHNSGFRDLAKWTHARGLKFGIHIIRGIPREAVTKNLPIANSGFHAADAADTADICPWNADNYGIKANSAGQAYYDSLVQLYAGWGVDFVKVDCIAAHPYKGEEIRMIHQAIAKANRPIMLSLSPGPAPIQQAAEFVKYSQMWRMSDDVWDHWAHDPAIGFSQSVSEQFTNAAQWAPYATDGHWPDADMLPIGFLGPRPGQGQARPTKLTQDEQRTMVTAWVIFRSPLILGANLTRMDAWTTSLVDNPEVLAANQQALAQHEVMHDSKEVVWTSEAKDGTHFYVAVFNLTNEPSIIETAWSSLKLPSGQHAIRDLWGRKDLSAASKLTSELPAHGAALYWVATN